MVSAMHPWDMQHDVCLAPYTTLEVGGRAANFVAVVDFSWLAPLCAWAKSRALPIAILGGGSNLVIGDKGVSGLVIHLKKTAAGDADVILKQRAQKLDISVSAHTSWQALVDASCRAGSFDLACLSGIPGLCGAAPVHNIGAYGQSLSDTLISVDGVCLQTGAACRWGAQELGLGYRTSYFKTLWQGRYIITRLHLRLQTQTRFVSAYPQLSQALEHSHGPGPYTPDAVRQSVLHVRACKSMLWDPCDPNRRSVGSFFINPLVETSHAQALRRRYASMPSWPQGAYTKLSAAWLIEQAGFVRGFRHKEVGLSSRHALALINLGKALAQDVIELAGVLQKRVAQSFGVGLAAEPCFWGFGSDHPLPAPPHRPADMQELDHV